VNAGSLSTGKGHPYTRIRIKPVSSKTVQGHVRGLKAFLTWLHRDGYTNENRLKNLKVPRAIPRVMEPLTAAKQQIILETAKTINVRDHETMQLC